MSSSTVAIPTFQALAANIKNADGTTPIYLSGAWTFQNAIGQTSLNIDSSGNIGIGTINPSTYGKLAITGSSSLINSISTASIGNNYISFFCNSGSVSQGFVGFGSLGANSMQIWNQQNSLLQFGTNNIERMKIHTDGFLYVSNMPTVSSGVSSLTGAYNVSEVTIADGYYGTALHWQSVIPSGYRQHASLGSWRNGAWGSVFLGVGGNDNSLTAFWTFASGGASYNPLNSSSWSTTSDIRIKQNIRPLNDSIQKIISLNPVHFEYVDKPEKIKTGFIAQEFEQVLPGHVHETGCPESISNIIPELKNEQIKAIDADLIPYLVGAIKEQQTQIQQLKSEIEFLKDKILTLE